MQTQKDRQDIHHDIRAALSRFAAVAPKVSRQAVNQAEITVQSSRLLALLDLALDPRAGKLEPKETKALSYAMTRIHSFLDQAEVASAFTDSADGPFDERRFADNLMAADADAIHTAARIVAFDTDGLTPSDIAGGFHAFDGVSAGFGPTLIERIKALIVAILSILARRGFIKSRVVQRVIDILARIDELLGGEVLFPPPARPTKRFVTLDAGENLTVDVPVPLGKTAFFQRVAFDDEGGGDENVQLSIRGVPAGRLTSGKDVVAISGPATVTLQFTTQNAGVQAVVCVVTA